MVIIDLGRYLLRRRENSRIIPKNQQRIRQRTTLIMSRGLNNHNNHTLSTHTSSHSQACAACKYQRRKCAPNCPLAPYFPPNRQKDFLNAHKLFGVSNILKTLRNLNDPRSKDYAVKSIVFQANVRASDPVGGCFRLISDLHRRIEQTRAQLDFVRRQLAFYRSAAAGSNLSFVFPQPPVPHYDPPPCGYQPLETYYDPGGGDPVKDEVLGKQALADVSEDIKPLLEMFHERQSDSINAALDAKPLTQTKCSEKIELEEDGELVQQEEEQGDR